MDKNYEQKLLEHFKENDKFANHNGIEVLEVKKGWSRVKVDVDSFHLNGVGITHGGLLFSLADIAFGLAANSHGQSAVTLNANISFLNASFVGQTLIAEAEEIALKNRVGSYLVSIKDEKGVLLASMQCQAYRKNVCMTGNGVEL